MIPHDINANAKINAAFNHGENLISAIKDVKAHYGVGLKEAKDMVEGLRVKHINGPYYLSLPETPGALAHLYLQEKNSGRCEDRIPPYVELPQKPRGRCGAVFKREDPDMVPDQSASATSPLTPPPGSLSAKAMQALAYQAVAGIAAEGLHKTALRRITEIASNEQEAARLISNYLQTQNLMSRDPGKSILRGPAPSKIKGKEINEVYTDEYKDIGSAEDAVRERELNKIFVGD